jgi:hypothetical protein
MWPTNASLDRATPSTAKAGKPHRDLAEMRRYGMVPVVLHMTNATTVSAIRPANRVAPSLCGNDFLLEACQQPSPVGHGQTQVGDIFKIIQPVDRQDVGERLFTVSPDFHQPHNPSHTSTPGKITDAQAINRGRSAPSPNAIGRATDRKSSGKRPARHGSNRSPASVQLQQVLLNLVINAIQAMSDVHDWPRELIIRSKLHAPDDGVLIAVEDSGTGLEAVAGDSTFDSMFTTKADGMGMGLSISRSIIAAQWRPDMGVARYGIPALGSYLGCSTAMIVQRNLPNRPAIETQHPGEQGR